MQLSQNPQSVQSNSYNPLHFFWFFQYLGVFLIFFSLSLIRILKNLSIEGLFSLFLSLCLIIFFYLIGKKFNLLFKEHDLLVGNLFNKPTLITANSIKKVSIRQGAIGRILGINNLYIQFLPTEIKKTQQYPLKFFGLPIKDATGLQFPMIWGDLICIPDISKKNTDKLINDLNNLTGGNLIVENTGVSYPWYKTLSKIYYVYALLFVLLISILILSFLIIALIYRK
ncbi:MAG: hypothetical protein HYW86_03420 [Candidatus Roizmanbacteria bacterium]|nr:MAG: hypothetical protein HYW86_03420 [Candidatus Roizmanbacteria bacterium]